MAAPGSPIGAVSSAAAAETGLPEGLCVVAGATDGTAAFLASGARSIGDYNTTLGTTLVFKGISSQICRHPQGVIYCHKLPGGRWLPGAASNVGTDWIGAMFAGGDLAAMDAAAASRLPSRHIAYPLVRSGERFPFLAPDARGFFDAEMSDKADRYAACLQGVALVERLGYQVLDAAAGTVPIFAPGLCQFSPAKMGLSPCSITWASRRSLRHRRWQPQRRLDAMPGRRHRPGRAPARMR